MRARRRILAALVVSVSSCAPSGDDYYWPAAFSRTFPMGYEALTQCLARGAGRPIFDHPHRRGVVHFFAGPDVGLHTATFIIDGTGPSRSRVTYHLTKAIPEIHRAESEIPPIPPCATAATVDVKT